jgi:hypothetical protein
VFTSRSATRPSGVTFASCFKVTAGPPSRSRSARSCLARLDLGEHVLDLTTTPGNAVDELTDPDPHHRRSRVDPSVAGATTYQRFRFVVIP